VSHSRRLPKVSDGVPMGQFIGPTAKAIVFSYANQAKKI